MAQGIEQEASKTAMAHHTKDKGDTGLGFVIADLMSKGVQIALPISEHLPFDCIAISNEGKLCRVSVKYREMRNGAIKVQTRSSWADRHGCHIRLHLRTDYDAIGIYCPDTKKCYYIRCEELASRSITLRIIAAKNSQLLKVKIAETFENPARIFSAK